MSREKANDPSPQSSLTGGAITLLVKPVYVGVFPYYGGSFTRSLMFLVGNTVHHRHQRVTFPRVGFCWGHLFHPAFLIDDQSLQEGCVINRSSSWLGIAPNVRRLVVNIFSLKDAAPRPLASSASLEDSGRTVGFRYVDSPGWHRTIRSFS